MHQGGFRRWLLLPGALAAAALLGTACERGSRPNTGGEYEGVANEQQSIESFGGQQQAPATGGSGQHQGAQPAPDEFNRPQQLPPGQESRTGPQGSPGGIGAPGHSTPEEQPTDQGGTRQFEELNGISNEPASGEDRGSRSPPRIDVPPEQQGTDTPRP